MRNIECMDKQFQNFLIFEISVVFQIEKILKILKFSNLENSWNFRFIKFLKFLIWKISQFAKTAIIIQFKKFTNFQILTIWNIRNFFNFTIWKIRILQYQKLLIISCIQTISKKSKQSSKTELSNNWPFFILIFAISKLRNTGRSTFRRSKVWPPPKCPKQLKKNFSNAFFLFSVSFLGEQSDCKNSEIWTKILNN